MPMSSLAKIIMRRSRKSGQQLRDVALVSRKNKIGTHIGQGLEDKPAYGHARMRQDEGGCVDDQLAGIEDIEIEGTRGVLSACRGASKFRLEADELPE